MGRCEGRGCGCSGGGRTALGAGGGFDVRSRGGFDVRSRGDFDGCGGVSRFGGT
jgi:hypothetical protein